MKPLLQVIGTLAFGSALALTPAPGQNQVNAVPLFRLQTASSGIYFYTTDQAEISRVTADGGWKIEGTTGWIFPSSVVGTTPLYRLARNKDGSHPEHFFTIHREEADKAHTIDGFKFEGVAGYVAAAQMPGTTPLIRLSSTRYGHFYTTNPEEASSAVKTSGYIIEGQEGFVWTGPSALAAIPPPSTGYRRIAGIQYFEFKSGAGDNFVAQGGFMCVTHNPGCGWIGNSGEDKFFSGAKQLPIGAQIVSVEFLTYPPAGLSGDDSGTIGGWGSYFSRIKSNSSNDSQPNLTTINWSNACQGVYGGKNLYYRISFIISVQDGTNLGEDSFETSSTPPPSCAPPGFKPQLPPPAGSGFSGTVKICNSTASTAVGTLHIEATVVNPLSGSIGAASMAEDIPVSFTPVFGTASVSSFSTQGQYKQGTWTITKAQVKPLTGMLQGLPLTVDLPGKLGSPVLDFSGGACN